MFSAGKGEGARLNGSPISTSGCVDVSCALVSCGLNVKVIQQINLPVLDEATRNAAVACKDAVLSNLLYCMHHCRDIRHLGSTALELCYVAAGRLDALHSLGPKEWDIAAAILIVREAGGCVIDLDGTELELHKERILAGATEVLTRTFVDHLKYPNHP
eukprot:XP_028343233.1 uncharacterized protein LOC114485638 [Physeter catodon]